MDGKVVMCRSYTCVYKETVAMDIPHKYLDAHDNGFKIKLNASSQNTEIVALTSHQIQRQLNIIEHSKYYHQDKPIVRQK